MIPIWERAIDIDKETMQPKPEPKIIGVLDHETKYDIYTIFKRKGRRITKGGARRSKLGKLLALSDKPSSQEIDQFFLFRNLVYSLKPLF